MRAAVVVFPGSNCDRDMVEALRQSGADVAKVWHKDAELPQGLDLVAIPGGFSFGDYLRCGAIAAQSPICRAVVDHAHRGGYVLGGLQWVSSFERNRSGPGCVDAQFWAKISVQNRRIDRGNSGQCFYGCL